MRAQGLYPRSALSALSFAAPPSGYLSAWDQAAASYGGQSARYLGPGAGAAQVAAQAPLPQIPDVAVRSFGLAQFLSDPYAAQVLPAAPWQLAFALQVTNASANLRWTAVAALYILEGATGRRRATLFERVAVGAALRTTTAEGTCLATLAGAEARLFTGDVLCLELGISVLNTTGAAVAPVVQLWTDGASPISADAAATADAQALLYAPVPLLGALPEFGEQPSAAVTQAAAVELLLGHFPPDNDYDFHDPASADAELVEALAAALKAFGYDLVDLLLREMDPHTAAQRIPDLEAAFNILYSSLNAELVPLPRRRAAVEGKLREFGGTTLFNVAAAVAALADYARLTYPEVLELPVAASAANDFAETLGLPVPLGTGFDDLILFRLTPQLLDGGVVSAAGVRLNLVFSSALVSGVAVQIRAPDFSAASWASVGPDGLSATVVLHGAGLAGAPVMGQWQLAVYRTGAPAITLVSWSLHVLGAPTGGAVDKALLPVGGGRARQRFVWSVYLDPPHQNVDPRVVRAFLARVTQASSRSFLCFGKDSTPGKPYHLPGLFVVT